MSRAVHRRYVAFSDAHYAGNLVDGAYSLQLFGDVGTDLSIELDGHEGLFAGYSSVEFLAPVRGGDVVEAEATLVQKGNRSRTVDFELRVVCRGSDDTGRAEVLNPPLIAARARGTAVIPAQATDELPWS
ncbi:hotdog domain-containing protein [Mycolicibacterium arseniciresistens]|jgi:3-aminobutyryl-CoA ammonia-lyase|uniref:Hotdog domain-containing protein n=1 Tax=Mycolicibacterium arseniciresistens TaxID=3062257 RepID=A0ABT8ULE4_9MYCO|nr:hotdog domain-containing protein [Mycolicibacterium arseniciresistens]MDO3638628.1 hotdog domain-containing protein [Mycolicibacterium arseniciresistens]